MERVSVGRTLRRMVGMWKCMVSGLVEIDSAGRQWDCDFKGVEYMRLWRVGEAEARGCWRAGLMVVNGGSTDLRI